MNEDFAKDFCDFKRESKEYEVITYLNELLFFLLRKNLT